MTLDILLVGSNLFMSSSVCLIFNIQCPLVRVKIEVSSQSNSACGVLLGDGSSCLEEPVQGRKRCSLQR
jgi:hypothetical protein